MKKYLLSSIFIAATISLTGIAQTSAPYRIFDLPTDVKSQALGGSHLVSGSKHYIYANPTDLFDSDETWTVAMTGHLLPEFEGMTRELYGSASIGYQFHQSHALFFGTRYLRGGKLDQVDDLGITTTKNSPPLQMSFDLGYAYRLNDHWSAFATASVITNNNTESNNSIFAGVGVSYRNTFEVLDSRATDLHASFSAYNLGQDVKYSQSMSFHLPSTIALGISAETPFDDQNTLGIKAQVSQVTSYNRTQIGTGLEYQYMNMLALRAGFNHFDTSVNYATVGLGFNLNPITIDASYIIGLNKYVKNTLAIGLSFDF